MLSAKAVDLSQSKQSDVRTLLIAMAIVPTVVVLIRSWSRALLPVSPTSHISSKFWWDDWMAFAAAAMNIAVCGMGLKLVELGMGLHVQAVPAANLEKFLKFLWIIYYFFDTGTALGKASALFFYARIFSINNSWFKYALWLVHAMNFLWLTTILLCVVFMCNPIKKAWETTLPGTCLDTGILWTGSGVTSLIIDFIILIMPLPMLWKLQLKTIRKLQICAVFICGYLVVVVSIGRVITIVEAGSQLQLDPTYSISTPVLWLGSEIAISTISVSMPSVYFLAQRVHSEGFWSLLPTQARTFIIGKTGTHKRCNDEENDGLVMQTNVYPYSSRTKATAEFGGADVGTASMRQNELHVMHTIEEV